MVIESIFGLLLTLPPDPALKCSRTRSLPGYVEGDIALVLDGELHKTSVRENVMSEIDPSEVESIQVTCWDPDTDKIPAPRGVPVMLVTTKSGLAQAEASMRSALRRVRSFVAARAERPNSADVLGPALVGYSISHQAGVWTLTSTPLHGHVCVATDQHVVEVEAECEAAASAAQPALRAAWAARKHSLLDLSG